MMVERGCWYGALLGALAAASRPAPLHLLNASGATCLDGTPAGYYYRPALNASFASLWVFSLEGGGECVDEASCAERSLGSLGSSKLWAATGESFLSQFQDDNATANPDLFGAHHVFVRYCTGDLHLGTVDIPGDAQWGWARFAGALVVDAVLDDLTVTAALSDAGLIVWSGDSAGGIGSAALLDAVAARLPSARVVGAPIAGFYWNNSHPYTGAGAAPFTPFDADAFRSYYTLWRARVPARCATEPDAPFAEEPWLCMMLNFSIPTLASEVFVIEFETDSVQLSLHDGVPEFNSTYAPYVLEFGRNMSGALTRQVVRSDATARRGLFAAACFEHTTFDTAKPIVEGASYLDAFGDWLFGRGAHSGFFMDDCCSGAAVQFNPTC